MSQQEAAKDLQKSGAALQEKTGVSYQDTTKVKKRVIVYVQHACAEAPHTTYITPLN